MHGMHTGRKGVVNTDIERSNLLKVADTADNSAA